MKKVLNIVVFLCIVLYLIGLFKSMGLAFLGAGTAIAAFHYRLRLNTRKPANNRPKRRKRGLKTEELIVGVLFVATFVGLAYFAVTIPESTTFTESRLVGMVGVAGCGCLFGWYYIFFRPEPPLSKDNTPPTSNDKSGLKKVFDLITGTGRKDDSTKRIRVSTRRSVVVSFVTI